MCSISKAVPSRGLATCVQLSTWVTPAAFKSGSDAAASMSPTYKLGATNDMGGVKARRPPVPWPEHRARAQTGEERPQRGVWGGSAELSSSMNSRDAAERTCEARPALGARGLGAR